MSEPTLGASAIRTIEHVWIPMPDGCRLSARIWLPEDADQVAVPAILEYIPYRKSDATAISDARIHPYFASHGYASVRVDLRGSGDSGGLLLDEYTEQELADGCEVIAWLSDQPWCSGTVGMMGISWGGFNALQVAARRPPALGGIISVCSTDDRYADDVHYIGGCVLGSEMLSWSTTMLGYGARPPDPSSAGPSWRERWLERLDVRPFVEEWLAHQRRDAYWQHGSVCEDLTAIDCPVFMVGGWYDPYRDAILRVLAGYPGPRQGLIGPWGHVYPHEGRPGPAVGFLQECLRFWDRWLKGADGGATDAPMLRAFVLEQGEDPSAGIVGRWVAEPTWPPADPRSVRFHLGGDHALVASEPLTGELAIRGSQTAGLEAGTFMGKGHAADVPKDQRREDGLSLCFTSAPLETPLEILGLPSVTLHVSSDRPLAIVAVRLCEVRADGTSHLVSRGVLNLTHRDSHEHPEPLESGADYSVTFPLNTIAYRFSAGSRVRLAVSPTYWPWAWPSPEPVTLTVGAGPSSWLELPVREPRADDRAVILPSPDEEPSPVDVTLSRRHLAERELSLDLADPEARLVHHQQGSFTLTSGVSVRTESEDRYYIVEGDPLSARAESERTIETDHGDLRSRVHVSSTMTADASYFHVTNAVEVHENDVRIAARNWSERLPRDLG